MKRLLLASCLLFTGCATMRHNLVDLKEGMTPQQVEETLGKPDGSKRYQNELVYEYMDRWMTAAYLSKADYFVSFENDKLTGYGTTAVRARDNGNVNFIVPVNTQPTYQPMPVPPPLMPGYSYGTP